MRSVCYSTTSKSHFCITVDSAVANHINSPALDCRMTQVSLHKTSQICYRSCRVKEIYRVTLFVSGEAVRAKQIRSRKKTEREREREKAEKSYHISNWVNRTRSSFCLMQNLSCMFMHARQSTGKPFSVLFLSFFVIMKPFPVAQDSLFSPLREQTCRLNVIRVESTGKAFQCNPEA